MRLFIISVCLLSAQIALSAPPKGGYLCAGEGESANIALGQCNCPTGRRPSRDPHDAAICIVVIDNRAKQQREANELFDRAMDALQRGEEKVVIENLKRAKVLYPSSKILLALARAYVLVQADDDASSTFELYLASGPPSEGAREARAAMLAIASRRASRPGALTIGSRPPCALYINDQFYGETPKRTMKFGPGKLHVTLVNEDAKIRDSFIVEIEPSKTSIVTKEFPERIRSVPRESPGSPGPHADIVNRLNEGWDAYEAYDFEKMRRVSGEAFALAQGAHLERDALMGLVGVQAGLAAVLAGDRDGATVMFWAAVQASPTITIPDAYRSSAAARLLEDARTMVNARVRTVSADDSCVGVHGLQHSIVDTAKAGASLPMTTQLGEDVRAAKVALMVRPEGAMEFVEITMVRTHGCTYDAVVPDRLMRGSIMHYYVAAFDVTGKSIFAKGSAGSPNIIELTGGNAHAVNDSEDPIAGTPRPETPTQPIVGPEPAPKPHGCGCGAGNGDPALGLILLAFVARRSRCANAAKPNHR